MLISKPNGDARSLSLREDLVAPFIFLSCIGNLGEEEGKHSYKERVSETETEIYKGLLCNTKAPVQMQQEVDSFQLHESGTANPWEGWSPDL